MMIEKNDLLYNKHRAPVLLSKVVTNSFRFKNVDTAMLSWHNIHDNQDPEKVCCQISTFLDLLSYGSLDASVRLQNTLFINMWNAFYHKRLCNNHYVQKKYRKIILIFVALAGILQILTSFAEEGSLEQGLRIIMYRSCLDRWPIFVLFLFIVLVYNATSTFPCVVIS